MERSAIGRSILLTLYAGPGDLLAGDREKCIQTGYDDYATKPIDRKKLIEAIQGHVCPLPAQ